MTQPDRDAIRTAVNDAGHLFLFGGTQTGKTTTALEMYNEAERVGIWVNDRGKHRVEGVKTLADGSYKSLKGVKNAFSRDEARIEFLPSDRSAGLTRLQDWLWEVEDRVNRELPVTIYIDELHKVAPQSGKNYGNLPGRDRVRDIAKEGMKRNVKLVAMDQRPQAVDNGSVSERQYLIALPMAAEQHDYVRKRGVDLDQVARQPDYTGVLYDKQGRTLSEGVKAQERYA